MTTKEITVKIKKVQKLKTIRITIETEKKLQRIMSTANKKQVGRKIKVDQLIGLAMDLVLPDHLKKLQETSLTNEDRKEILRQKYIEKIGPTSKDEFTGFMMTTSFLDFLKENSTECFVTTK